MRIQYGIAGTLIASALVLGVSPTASAETPAVKATASKHLVPVSDVTLEWAISECAFNKTVPACGSLTETQVVEGNVAVDDSGWVWSDGSGTYNQATGASRISFDGSVSIGNTTRGGYSITFADLTVAVDRQGNGRVTADVTYRAAAAAPPVTQEDVLIVNLPDAGFAEDWIITPPWDGVAPPAEPAPVDGAQFAQPLIDLLPASLEGWFWKTNSGSSNPYKAPSPITLSADRKYKPTIVVSPSKGISVSKATTITVRGYGFDPSVQGQAAQGIYVVFGPNAAKVKDGYANTNLYNAVGYLPQGPTAIGTFQTELNIKGKYKVGTKVYDGSKGNLGVSTWAAHSHATTVWDAYQKVGFKKK